MCFLWPIEKSLKGHFLEGQAQNGLNGTNGPWSYLGPSQLPNKQKSMKVAFLRSLAYLTALLSLLLT